MSALLFNYNIKMETKNYHAEQIFSYGFFQTNNRILNSLIYYTEIR